MCGHREASDDALFYRMYSGLGLFEEVRHAWRLHPYVKPRQRRIKLYPNLGSQIFAASVDKILTRVCLNQTLTEKKNN